MADTTFGNVQANLSYKKMTELVSQLKVGDTVKLRDDLKVGCVYYIDQEGSFEYRHPSYRVKSGSTYEIGTNEEADKSLAVEGQWISYNMVDIDWLVEYFKQKTIENTVEPKIEEETQAKYEVEDFYSQVQKLSEIARKELQEAVDKLNEAIAKVNLINKEIAVTLSSGYTASKIKAVELGENDWGYTTLTFK